MDQVDFDWRSKGGQVGGTKKGGCIYGGSDTSKVSHILIVAPH